MPDVLDEIIDRLPPSAVRLISEYDKDRLNHSAVISNLLRDSQRLKLEQISRELKRKVFNIKSKTAENRNYLSKLNSELEVLNSLKEPEGNQQSLKAYTLKIEELECQIRNLTKDHGDVDLTQLFNEIEDLNQQIEDYKKRIAEAKIQYQSYENFPPDIEQGKEAIAKIKERIKQHELAFFQKKKKKLGLKKSVISKLLLKSMSST